MNGFSFTDPPGGSGGAGGNPRYTPDPARVALRELVEAAEGYISPVGWTALGHARLVLALNAARNALHMGRVLDEIAADPSIGHGHVGSVG